MAETKEAAEIFEALPRGQRRIRPRRAKRPQHVDVEMRQQRVALTDYLEAKEATANSKRTIEFDRERLEIVKRHLGDVKL